MRLLKPKNINRAIVALALLAPIGYLFGTQLAALAGAHGEHAFADTGEVTSIDVPMTRSLYIDPTTGVFVNGPSRAYNTYDGYYHFDSDIVFHYSTSVTSGYNLRIYYYDADYAFISFSELQSPVTGVISSVTGYYFSLFSLNSADFNLSLSGFSTVTVDYFDTVSYTEYLFGNMFGKSNFLTDIGENAISDNPKGFAPFGHLMAFIDSNMLHIGDTPTGLLGYGYLYWCAHVLVLDLLCYFMTFFIRLIKSIVDKWEVSQW